MAGCLNTEITLFFTFIELNDNLQCYVVLIEKIIVIMAIVW
jgi:hypothetical protein